jgi:hypothetical protein
MVRVAALVQPLTNPRLLIVGLASVTDRGLRLVARFLHSRLELANAALDGRNARGTAEGDESERHDGGVAKGGGHVVPP